MILEVFSNLNDSVILRSLLALTLQPASYRPCCSAHKAECFSIRFLQAGDLWVAPADEDGHHHQCGRAVPAPHGGLGQGHHGCPRCSLPMSALTAQELLGQGDSTSCWWRSAALCRLFRHFLPALPIVHKTNSSPRPGKGLIYRASELIHPGRGARKHRDCFFCRSQGADSLRYVKSNSRRGVPAAVMQSLFCHSSMRQSLCLAP